MRPVLPFRDVDVGATLVVALLVVACEHCALPTKATTRVASTDSLILYPK